MTALTPNQPESSLTLASVKDQFSQWRQIKAKGAKIPDDLWRQVFSLEGRYRYSTLLNTLGISSTQYRKVKARLTNTQQARPSSAKFVELTKSIPLIESKVPASANQVQPLIVDCKRSDGAVLSIQGLAPDTVSQLIANFYGRR